MGSSHTTVHTDIIGDPDFLRYPTYKVVSVFPDHDKVGAAVSELRAAGFAENDIEAFCGIAEAEKVDFAGTKHGVWDHLVRSFQHVADRTFLEPCERHLKAGHCLIMVKVTNSAQKTRAAEILPHFTDEKVNYFGLLTVDELK